MPEIAAHAPARASRAVLAGGLAVIAGLYAYYFVNAFKRVGAVKPSGLATGDFEHFYFGARSMLEGTDLYSSGHHGYIYPPLLAFLYTPFARLDLDAAALTLLIVNLSLGLLTAWIAGRAVAERLGSAVAPGAAVLVGAFATVLAFDKLKGEYQMWQTNVLVMLMFAVALWQLDRRPWLAGLALGLAFNIKYLPVVALPYLLLRRRWAGAAWFAAGIVAFAFLPALLVGWKTNLGYLGTAFAGFARLVGFDTGTGPKANIDGITAPYSVSITSALARVLGDDRGYAHGGAAALALAAAAGVGLVYAALLWGMYRHRHVPVAAWPAAPDQRAMPWRALVAVEWIGLLVAVLAFGPQTNMRHMSLLLLVFAPAAGFFLLVPAALRRPSLIVGTAVLFLGITLPPGGETFEPAVRAWHRVGGPAVCLLVYYAGLLWATLGWIAGRRAPRGATSVTGA